MNAFLRAVEARILAEREERMTTEAIRASRDAETAEGRLESQRQRLDAHQAKREAVIRQARMDPSASPAVIGRRCGSSRLFCVKVLREEGLYVPRGAGGRILTRDERSEALQAEYARREAEARAKVVASMQALGPLATISDIHRHSGVSRTTARRHIQAMARGAR